MSDGIRVWDASGRLVFDVSKSIFTFLGVISEVMVNTTGDQTGSITDAALAQGIPFAIVTKYPLVLENTIVEGAPVPVYTRQKVIIDFDGTTLNWRVTPGPVTVSTYLNRDLRIAYGYR